MVELQSAGDVVGQRVPIASSGAAMHRAVPVVVCHPAGDRGHAVVLAPWRVAARYDAVADAYASTADDYTGSAMATLLELVGPDPGPRVLDVACGHGPVARELARRGADVIGVDISSKLLNRARSWVVGASPDIEYVAGDATEPTLLEGEVFDLIVCNFGLSDIDDLDGACATVARLLVAGGRFVFSILHPCFAGADDVSGSWPTGRSYYDEGFWRAEGQRSVLRRSALRRGLLQRTTRRDRCPTVDWQYR